MPLSESSQNHCKVVQCIVHSFACGIQKWKVCKNMEKRDEDNIII